MGGIGEAGTLTRGVTGGGIGAGIGRGVGSKEGIGAIRESEK